MQGVETLWNYLILGALKLNIIGLFPYSLFFAIPALSVAVVFTCLGTIDDITENGKL